VMASNIHWQWTPNGYIPALFGILLAWIATLLMNSAITLLQRGLGKDQVAE